MSPTFSLIAAMDRKRTIGSEGEMPWHLPADLAYFRRRTWGKPIVMGRKTYESIGRPLPGRDNIILTRDRDFKAEGCLVVHSVDELLRLQEKDLASNADEVMVIGGGEIYRLLMPMADKMYITRIDAEFEGDTFFPEWDEHDWELIEQFKGSTDDKNVYPHQFLIYKRKNTS